MNFRNPDIPARERLELQEEIKTRALGMLEFVVDTVIGTTVGAYSGVKAAHQVTLSRHIQTGELESLEASLNNEAEG